MPAKVLYARQHFSTKRARRFRFARMDSLMLLQPILVDARNAAHITTKLIVGLVQPQMDVQPVLRVERFRAIFVGAGDHFDNVLGPGVILNFARRHETAIAVLALELADVHVIFKV